MSDHIILLTDQISQLVDWGADYHPHDRLTHDELTALSNTALSGLATMNGDTCTVQITGRQLALLMYGAMTGKKCMKEGA